MKFKRKLTVLILCFYFSQIISCGFRAMDNEESGDYKWQLTFEDQFNSFDSTKWITHHDNGGRTIWSNKELEWYKDDNVVIDNGVLKLIAKKETFYGKDLGGEKEFNYTSGMICSSFGFTQAYGKWEMKARFPFSKGFWPAFFLVPQQRPSLPEIDVFEYFGIDKNKIWSNHHWGIDYPNYEGGIYAGKSAPFYYSEGKETNGDFEGVWMVWSFECFPNNMIWKLNGNVIFESTVGIPTAPLYMIANVAVKDYKENNFTVDNSNLPYEMEIDYIKVYKMVPKND